MVNLYKVSDVSWVTLNELKAKQIFIKVRSLMIRKKVKALRFGKMVANTMANGLKTCSMAKANTLALITHFCTKVNINLIKCMARAKSIGLMKRLRMRATIWMIVDRAMAFVISKMGINTVVTLKKVIFRDKAL